ncbi:hypothetical protein ACFU7R_22740 [Streptomyces halstedii]|uniref:hypothetical protein n=1 Tax=Streptomyces halstedii TaxID=1944 RepID=UPI0036B9394D
MATGQATVDLDGVLILAHSDKQVAATTWKKACGHHLLMVLAELDDDVLKGRRERCG